ncbi:male-specific lethal 1 homolog isoform X2 [Stegodyphus dumicola]|uniref:male-specific lethal 1 homolog isoform X2 n=1 Tax=Stegodyphus dumicola TaxID=202533 RepID=UPI0015AB696F|nr:male-specific lethal 1 homolog isoform X2 [Stegodyphus dumicola]
MKSGAVEPDRLKIEGRQSIHRRKMSKNSPIVNGADESHSYAAEDETLRQVNLAAAYHDHISCTKSADLCKIDGGKEGRINLPCETDHIYANCSEMKNKSHNTNAANSPSNSKDLSVENKRLRDMVLVQLELIKQLQEDSVKKDRQIMSLKQENETLRSRFDRRERRMCLMRKRYSKSDEESADNISDVGSAVSDANVAASSASVSNERTNSPSSVNLVTRYFGRKSKTIPSRALKRRYLGPPKSLPLKKSILKSVSSATSISSASETHDEELSIKQEILNMTKLPVAREKTIEPDVKKIHKRHDHRPKGVLRGDFLTTNKAYFLPDNQASSNSLSSSETNIDVPSWKYKPVTSFYQMEGTENINDSVFHRRHLKCEQDERRRKRWDMQRLREQKASEKLKYKQTRDADKESENHVQRKSQSFYPNPRHMSLSLAVEFIEVTEQLPVLAFGHPIPLFQPSEFTLPWRCSENQSYESVEIKAKKSRSTAAVPKVT